MKLLPARRAFNSVSRVDITFKLGSAMGAFERHGEESCCKEWTVGVETDGIKRNGSGSVNGKLIFA